LGIEIPEEYGGMGLDKVSGCIASEASARDGSFAVSYMGHTGIGTLPIVYFGTKEQKQKYLPSSRAASGSARTRCRRRARLQTP
jgi:alkylation response protein AidB-like acyl-CoA dehydrogenase